KYNVNWIFSYEYEDKSSLKAAKSNIDIVIKTVKSREEFFVNLNKFTTIEKSLFFHKDYITYIRTQSLPFYEVTNDDLKYIGDIVDSQGKLICFKELFRNHNKLLIYNCMSFKDWPCVGCTCACKQ